VIPGLAPQALDGFEQWLRTENAGPGRVSLHYAGQGSADGRYVLLIDGEKPLLVPFTDLRGTPRP
jgi:hypothetical protein